MAAAAPAPQDLLLSSLMMEKETFWLNNQHLTETEITQRWEHRAAQIRLVLGPSPPQPLPIQNPVSQKPYSNPQYTHMVRSRSDQPAPRSLDRNQAISHGPTTMSRKRSNGADTRISPLTITSFQYSGNDPFSSWAMPSPKMQRTASGRRSLEQVPEIAVYENVGDYIKTQLDSSGQPFKPSPSLRPQYSRRPSHRRSMSSTTTSPFSGSVASSLPSSMPTTSGLTDTSTFASNMSRQSSQATNSLCGEFDMIKIQSQHSDMSDFSMGEDHILIESTADVEKSRFSSFDQSHLIDYAGGIIEDYDISSVNLLPAVSLPPLATASTVQTSSVQKEVEMNRSSSAESNTSLLTGVSKRRQKQLLHSERPLAPKLSDEQISMSRQSSSTGHKVYRKISADGLVKDVVVIPKQQCTRPSREKVRCDKCNEHAEGFRGEHELRRHTERAHCTLRKTWVCIDASTDKKMLANCKACRSDKMYGAYYNAAAHLRRVHFNPKPKGRNNKVKTEERRGGKGGGDFPSMEFLKAWMKEVEEYVPDNNVPNDKDDNSNTASTSLFDVEGLRTDENQGDFEANFGDDFGDDFVSSQPQTTLAVDIHAMATADPASMPTASPLDYSRQLHASSRSAVVSSNPDFLEGAFGLVDTENYDDLMFGTLEFSPNLDQDSLNFGGYQNTFSEGH